MGWYFTYGASRRQVIEELLEDQRREDGSLSSRVLRHCCKGNVLYTLQENIGAGGSLKFIGIHLLQRSGEGWGYKPMDESMGPYYYNCPLKYLDEASEPVNQSAADWRASVREFAAQKAKRPQVGEIWSCMGKYCKRVRIASVLGRRIEAYNLTAGGYYRIPKKLLGERIVEGGDPI